MAPNVSSAITKIGKYTSEAYNITVHHWGEGYVEIGAFCSIAKDVHIMLGGRHNSKAISTYGFGYGHKETFTCDPPLLFTRNPNVIIGNDVWIGRWVTIMRGVTIGDGAIIAARSHVVKNVEPYTIVGGNPARFIHYRFGGTVIDKLLKLRWWDMEDEQINEIVPWLVGSDVGGLTEKVEKLRSATVAFNPKCVYGDYVLWRKECEPYEPREYVEGIMRDQITCVVPEQYRYRVKMEEVLNRHAEGKSEGSVAGLPEEEARKRGIFFLVWKYVPDDNVDGLTRK